MISIGLSSREDYYLKPGFQKNVAYSLISLGEKAKKNIIPICKV